MAISGGEGDKGQEKVILYVMIRKGLSEGVRNSGATSLESEDQTGALAFILRMM